MGRATTFNPKSQNDPNLIVNLPPELTNAKRGTAKHQPNLHSQAPAEPRLKQKDKPFIQTNAKVQALWDTGAQVSIMSEA